MRTAPQSQMYDIKKNKNLNVQQNIPSSWVFSCLCRDGGLPEMESSQVYFPFSFLLVCCSLDRLEPFCGPQT